jgi:hypothetical protein
MSRIYMVFVAETVGGMETMRGIQETLTKVLEYRKITPPCKIQSVFAAAGIPEAYNQRALESARSAEVLISHLTLCAPCKLGLAPDL